MRLNRSQSLKTPLAHLGPLWFKLQNIAGSICVIILLCANTSSLEARPHLNTNQPHHRYLITLLLCIPLSLQGTNSRDFRLIRELCPLTLIQHTLTLINIYRKAFQNSLSRLSRYLSITANFFCPPETPDRCCWDMFTRSECPNSVDLSVRRCTNCMCVHTIHQLIRFLPLRSQEAAVPGFPISTIGDIQTNRFTVDAAVSVTSRWNIKHLVAYKQVPDVRIQECPGVAPVMTFTSTMFKMSPLNNSARETNQPTTTENVDLVIAEPTFGQTGSALERLAVQKPGDPEICRSQFSQNYHFGQLRAGKISSSASVCR